jgi:type VI secretion system protein ImpA
LRVCIMLARAAAASDGPAGLAAGLELLREICARFWDELHPALDSEASDPGDQAFRRITALNELADRSGLLRDLRDIPILEARGIGRFGLRAIHLAQGKEAPGPGEGMPEPGMIQAALSKDPGLADTRAAIVAARQALGGLDQELRGRPGPRAARQGLGRDGVGARRQHPGQPGDRCHGPRAAAGYGRRRCAPGARAP